jgi:hypothetical protein
MPGQNLDHVVVAMFSCRHCNGRKTEAHDGRKPGSASRRVDGDHLIPLSNTGSVVCTVSWSYRAGRLMNVGDVKGVEELIYCVQFDLT